MMHMARCTGCGDLGDAAHIAACASARISRAMRDGAELVLRMAETQLRRRGSTDIAALRTAISRMELPPTHGRAWLRFASVSSSATCGGPRSTK